MSRRLQNQKMCACLFVQNTKEESVTNDSMLYTCCYVHKIRKNFPNSDQFLCVQTERNLITPKYDQLVHDCKYRYYLGFQNLQKFTSL